MKLWCLVETPLLLFLGHWILSFWEPFVLCFYVEGIFDRDSMLIAVAVTMEKLSNRKAYAVFSEDGQRLNLPNFLITCSYEVHFVTVASRLKIPLAHLCFLLGFTICSVLMEKMRSRMQKQYILLITREVNVLFCGCLGNEFIWDFWCMLRRVC